MPGGNGGAVGTTVAAKAIGGYVVGSWGGGGIKVEKAAGTGWLHTKPEG